MSRMTIVGLIALAALTARAEVDLDWNPPDQTVNVGEIVAVDLWAEGDPQDEPFVLLLAVMQWEPEILELVGCDARVSSYDWLDELTGFLPDDHADGLNNTFTDGNAYFSAGANLVDRAPCACCSNA